ncbi:MAG: MaoC family dehydratase N-terminal domain-containing protein [Chloroflexi bacterium]|nr:MaoC family dehydratase N-terminal domain-containing protein [Chloroflexota bacterium]
MGKDNDMIKSYSGPPEKTLDYSKVAHLVGQSSPFHEPHDIVTKSDIRHWCEVMQDSNPLYTDEEYAQDSRYGSIIAPPSMVQTWSLDDMHDALQRFVHANQPFKEDPHNQLFDIIDSEGYNGVVATAQEQWYLKSIRPGDTIRSKITVANVSKYDHHTRQGVGRYVDIVFTFINQRDEEVCKASFRVLKYKPPMDTRHLYEG